MLWLMIVAAIAAQGQGKQEQNHRGTLISLYLYKYSHYTSLVARQAGADWCEQNYFKVYDTLEDCLVAETIKKTTSVTLETTRSSTEPISTSTETKSTSTETISTSTDTIPTVSEPTTRTYSEPEIKSFDCINDWFKVYDSIDDCLEATEKKPIIIVVPIKRKFDCDQDWFKVYDTLNQS